MTQIKGLVSVTIPFYNAERFLGETIDSVLAQTHTDWELFLVDDGSTDRSAEIARGYSAQSPDKIRYIEHPGHRNLGVTYSRNFGVRSSNGEFLAFLDSDDVWLPQKLECQVRMMEANPEAGLIYGPSEYWFDWDPNRDEQQPNHVPSLAPGGNLYFPPNLLTSSFPMGGYGAPCPSSFLLRRSAFERVGGFVESFDPSTYQLLEDTAFLSKVYLKVPVFVADCCLDRYRCHSDSICHRTVGTHRLESETRYYFRWLRQYLLQEQVTDPALWRAIRKAAWAYWLPLPAFVTRFVWRARNRLMR
jgi:glycosyltransferase involved in cell wall biosynthesis